MFKRLDLRSVLVTLFVVLLLHIAVLAGYALRVRAAAKLLIDSATRIQTASDADRLALAWEDSSFRRRTAFHSREFQGFEFEVRSGLLTSLHLVPSTGLLMQVIITPGNKNRVVMGMYTAKTSVWVQEEPILDNNRMDSENDHDGNHLKTSIMLGPNTSESLARKALDLNPNCLVKLGGCRNAGQMLPVIPQIERELKESGEAIVTERRE